MNTIKERGWEIDSINKIIILYYPYKLNGIEKETVKNIAFEDIREIQISLEKSTNYFVLFIIKVWSGDMFLIDPFYIYETEEQFKNCLNNLMHNITFYDPYNIMQRYLSTANFSLKETVIEILSDKHKFDIE